MPFTINRGHHTSAVVIAPPGATPEQVVQIIDVTTKTAEQETAIPVGTIEHVHQNLIQTIVDELNGQGTCPSTIESALRTAWVCEQVYQQQDD